MNPDTSCLPYNFHKKTFGSSCQEFKTLYYAILEINNYDITTFGKKEKKILVMNMQECTHGIKLRVYI